MTSGQPITMTVLYVANTGHVLAALTRTDGSGAAPSVSDLTGDGLLLRGNINQNTPTLTVFLNPYLFTVSASDMQSLDFQIDPTNTPTFRNPRAFGISPVPGSTPTASPPPPPPTLNLLGPINTQKSSAATTSGFDLAYDVSSGQLIIHFSSNLSGQNLQYYALVVQTVTDPTSTPVIVCTKYGSTSSGPVSQTLTQSTQVSLLILVQNMLPIVDSF
jgi:hypothetical protein